MAATSANTKHNGASQQVLTYLREHCNTVIPYPELTKAIGATHNFTVPNAITHLVRLGLPVERPMRGFALYRTMPLVPEPEPMPEEKPTQKLYEYIGQSGGVTIVKGEDNELYVVSPLVEFVTRP